MSYVNQLQLQEFLKNMGYQSIFTVSVVNGHNSEALL